MYIEQVQSHDAMRIFTEIGRWVFMHSTGVGKAVLSLLPEEHVRAFVHRTGLPAQTSHTITDPDDLVAALHDIRRSGFAIDDGEQEVGVRCVAVPVKAADVRMALSMSGPDARMSPEQAARAILMLTVTSRQCRKGRMGETWIVRFGKRSVHKPSTPERPVHGPTDGGDVGVGREVRPPAPSTSARSESSVAAGSNATSRPSSQMSSRRAGEQHTARASAPAVERLTAGSGTGGGAHW